MLRSYDAALFALLLVVADVRGQTQPTTQPSTRAHVRIYFIAADEVDWTYVPSRGDQAITGNKDDFANDSASRGTLDPNATTYRKATFREYADSSFRSLKPRPADWTHLGILGPLIRAEVGDTIKVVFKNNATRAYSLHPHGVFYRKDSEGFAYLDGTSGADKQDDAVAPGASHTYIWPVPERAGPSEGDGSTAFWLYHSHVNEGRDINAGLIGPIIITRRGMARLNGSPKDVDREFITQFGLFDETLSWYWDWNVARIYGDPRKYERNDTRVQQFHHFYTINGFLEGNGPMLTMRARERVRWYVFANPNEENARADGRRCPYAHGHGHVDPNDVRRSRHASGQSGRMVAALPHARALSRGNVHPLHRTIATVTLLKAARRPALPTKAENDLLHPLQEVALPVDAPPESTSGGDPLYVQQAVA